MDVMQEIVRMFSLDTVEQIERDNEIYGENGFLSFRSKIRVKRSNGEIVKGFVKLSDTSRAELGDMQEASNHFCRNECIFYCIMAPILDKIFSRCQLPQPYPVTFGQKLHSSGTILVMEDLMEQGYYLPKNMLSMAEALSAVETLAKVQAAYWIARTDMDYSMDNAIFGSRSPFCDQVQAAAKSGKVNLELMMKVNADSFLKNFANFLENPEDESLIRDRVQLLQESILDTLLGRKSYDSKIPLGIFQGDFWLANIMFKEEAASKELNCKILDWQLWSIGPFGMDLGILFMSSLPHQTFVQEVDNLFSRFYSTFKEIYETATGLAAPISEQQAQENLEHALFYGIFWVVLTAKQSMASQLRPVGQVLANVAHSLRQRLPERPRFLSNGE